MIFYFIAVFIDWKVYDKNRNFRLIYCAKKSDPGRILQLKSDLSRLPFGTDKSRKILKFSFILSHFYVIFVLENRILLQKPIS